MLGWYKKTNIQTPFICVLFCCAPRPQTSRTRSDPRWIRRRRDHDHVATCPSAARLPHQELCRQARDRRPALHWSAPFLPLEPSHLVHSGGPPWDPRAHQNQPRCPLLARPLTTAALCTRFAAVSLPASRLSASELPCARHYFSAAFSLATLYTHSVFLFAYTHVEMHARATAAP